MNADHTPRPTGGWPNDENRPVFAAPPTTPGPWWRRLGLAEPRADSEHERAKTRARRQLLASLQPEGFARWTDAGTEHLGLDDVVAELDQVEKTIDQGIEDAARARRERGWDEVRAALSAPDADVLIEDGPWGGFTRGRAVAWCWNLFQYEPRGFVHPGSQVRAEALRLLESGGLPTVFGYPSRAAALERTGLTPETYRHAVEALGRPTFTPADVRHR